VTTTNDVQPIVALTIAYAAALDDRDEDALHGIFVAGATLDLGPYGVRTMPAAVERFRSAHTAYLELQHRMLNHRVQVQGDTATCHCYVEGIFLDADGGRRVHGRYTFEAQRTDDGWRIAAMRFSQMFEEEAVPRPPRVRTS
jgi:hypothetical protein